MSNANNGASSLLAPSLRASGCNIDDSATNRDDQPKPNAGNLTSWGISGVGKKQQQHQKASAPGKKWQQPPSVSKGGTTAIDISASSQSARGKSATGAKTTSTSTGMPASENGTKPSASVSSSSENANKQANKLNLMNLVNHDNANDKQQPTPPPNKSTNNTSKRESAKRAQSVATRRTSRASTRNNKAAAGATPHVSSKGSASHRRSSKHHSNESSDERCNSEKSSNGKPAPSRSRPTLERSSSDNTSMHLEGARGSSRAMLKSTSSKWASARLLMETSMSELVDQQPDLSQVRGSGAPASSAAAAASFDVSTTAISYKGGPTPGPPPPTSQTPSTSGRKTNSRTAADDRTPSTSGRKSNSNSRRSTTTSTSSSSRRKSASSSRRSSATSSSRKSASTSSSRHQSGTNSCTKDNPAASRTTAKDSHLPHKQEQAPIPEDEPRRRPITRSSSDGSLPPVTTIPLAGATAATIEQPKTPSRRKPGLLNRMKNIKSQRLGHGLMLGGKAPNAVDSQHSRASDGGESHSHSGDDHLVPATPGGTLIRRKWGGLRGVLAKTLHKKGTGLLQDDDDDEDDDDFDHSDKRPSVRDLFSERGGSDAASPSSDDAGPSEEPTLAKKQSMRPSHNKWSLAAKLNTTRGNNNNTYGMMGGSIASLSLESKRTEGKTNQHEHDQDAGVDTVGAEQIFDVDFSKHNDSIKESNELSKSMHSHGAASSFGSSGYNQDSGTGFSFDALTELPSSDAERVNEDDSRRSVGMLRAPSLKLAEQSQDKTSVSDDHDDNEDDDDDDSASWGGTSDDEFVPFDVDGGALSPLQCVQLQFGPDLGKDKKNSLAISIHDLSGGDPAPMEGNIAVHHMDAKPKSPVRPVAHSSRRRASLDNHAATTQQRGPQTRRNSISNPLSESSSHEKKKIQPLRHEETALSESKARIRMSKLEIDQLRSELEKQREIYESLQVKHAQAMRSLEERDLTLPRI